MANQGASRLRLKVKFSWKIALCILFLVSILIRLGFWQLDRAQQKRHLQNDREARLVAAPVSVESLALGDKNALQYTKVVLVGSYDNEKSILVSNQVFQNRPGYEVLTVFELHSSDQIVLVSRGWAAADFGSNQLPIIELVTGVQQLVGEIHVPPSHSFFLPQKIDEPPNWPLRLHHFDIDDINRLFNRPVLPFVIRLDGNNPGVLKRHWPTIRSKPENSTSYAIQWFGMALVLIVITIVKSTNILEIIRSNKSTR